MHSIWLVIVETCFFLDNRGKQALLLWLERGGLLIHELNPGNIPVIRKTLDKYSDIHPDFTDVVLVTLAEKKKIRQILTVDQRDFDIYRFADGKTFTRLWV